MHATLLTLAIALSAAPGADSVVAAAFTQKADTKTDTVQSGPTASNFAAPVVLIVALAVIVVVARRRKALPGVGSIRVLEAASIGPKRQIVIADVMGERLALGVTDAGITVLSKRAIPAPAAVPVPRASLEEPVTFFERLKNATAKQPSFDQQLAESFDDQELRAKLSAGVKGVVP